MFINRTDNQRLLRNRFYLMMISIFQKENRSKEASLCRKSFKSFPLLPNYRQTSEHVYTKVLMKKIISFVQNKLNHIFKHIRQNKVPRGLTISNEKTFNKAIRKLGNKLQYQGGNQTNTKMVILIANRERKTNNLPISIGWMNKTIITNNRNNYTKSLHSCYINKEHKDEILVIFK